MKKKPVSSWMFLGLGLFCLALAALPAFGWVLARDSTGRIIFTVALLLVSVAWLGKFIHAKRSRGLEKGEL